LEQHPPSFYSLANKGIWEKLLEVLIDIPAYEWLMICTPFPFAHLHYQ
jgi:hypothetical protein